MGGVEGDFEFKGIDLHLGLGGAIGPYRDKSMPISVVEVNVGVLELDLAQVPTTCFNELFSV